VSFAVKKKEKKNVVPGNKGENEPMGKGGWFWGGGVERVTLPLCKRKKKGKRRKVKKKPFQLTSGEGEGGPISSWKGKKREGPRPKKEGRSLR